MLLIGVRFVCANRKTRKQNKTECSQYLVAMGVAEKMLEKIESKIRLEKEISEEELEQIPIHPYLLKQITK